MKGIPLRGCKELNSLWLYSTPPYFAGLLDIVYEITIPGHNIFKNLSEFP